MPTFAPLFAAQKQENGGIGMSTRTTSELFAGNELDVIQLIESLMSRHDFKHLNTADNFPGATIAIGFFDYGADEDIAPIVAMKSTHRLQVNKEQEDKLFNRMLAAACAFNRDYEFNTDDVPVICFSHELDNGEPIGAVMVSLDLEGDMPEDFNEEEALRGLVSALDQMIYENGGEGHINYVYGVFADRKTVYDVELQLDIEDDEDK